MLNRRTRTALLLAIAALGVGVAAWTGRGHTTGKPSTPAAAAPAVVSSSASLARTAERITITGTGFNAKPAHNTVLFSGGVTGKVVSATPTQLVVQFTQKPVGVGTLSAVVTTKGRSSGAPVVVATVVKPPRAAA